MDLIFPNIDKKLKPRVRQMLLPATLAYGRLKSLLKHGSFVEAEDGTAVDVCPQQQWAYEADLNPCPVCDENLRQTKALRDSGGDKPGAEHVRSCAVAIDGCNIGEWWRSRLSRLQRLWS